MVLTYADETVPSTSAAQSAITIQLEPDVVELESTSILPPAVPEPTKGIGTSPSNEEDRIISTAALLTVSSDPAEWVINDSTIDFLLSREINQNSDQDFSATKTFYPTLKKYRCLTKNTFQRKMLNGQKVDRKYLCYSPSKKALFCVPCRLFGGGTSKLGTEGVTDWRNVNGILNSHENSKEHLESRKCFLARSQTIGRIDTGLNMQIEMEFSYWRNVLKRVIAVVKKN